MKVIDECAIVKALAESIDTNAIAQAVLRHVKHELNEEPTLQMCKDVWEREFRSLIK